MTVRLMAFLFLFFGLAHGSAYGADIMFEGYYRLELQKKHVGYAIQRYEFDPKTKTFFSKSFLRAKLGDEIIQESVVAKCSDKFKPLAFQYTSQVGAKAKTVDATFKGLIMTVRITDGKEIKNETSKLPEGTFLSSFLPYMMLKGNSKEADTRLKMGDNFKYSAIAEEEGSSYNGSAAIIGKEPKPGYDTYTIKNRFKGEDFISKMAIVHDDKAKRNIKGEVLSTNSPAKGLSTHLVATAVQATEGQVVPNAILKKVFGSTPVGKLNIASNPASVSPPKVNLEPGPAIIRTPVPPSETSPDDGP